MAVTYAIVICHGSYHTPVPYQPFVTALQNQGIEAYCPQLPTSDLRKMNVGLDGSPDGLPDFDRPPPANGYPQPYDDGLVINELLDKLIEKEHKHVVLVGHSSGGFVATYVAKPNYQRKVRQANNLGGGLIGIVYVCAFLVPVGESVHSFFQPKDGSPTVVPPYCRFHGNGFESIASTVNGAQYFFNGLSEEKAKYYESTLTASPIMTTVLDNDAYIELPCAYVITGSDLALPAAYQESMVEMQARRAGVHMTLYRCDSGHSPHLTWTDGLVQCIQSWVQSIV